MLKATGSKDFGETWTNWWLFTPETTDEEIEKHVGDLGGYYTGPGQGFSHRASVRRTPTRILVTQYAGIDV